VLTENKKGNNKKVNTTLLKTQMLNQMHNIHRRDTNDGGQAMGEALRYVQMSC